MNVDLVHTENKISHQYNIWGSPPSPTTKLFFGGKLICESGLLLFAVTCLENFLSCQWGNELLSLYACGETESKDPNRYERIVVTINEIKTNG
jgi:hypothetical protein